MIVCVMFVVFDGFSYVFSLFFVFQAEDGIRDLVRSRGLGDVYKRQILQMWHSVQKLRAKREKSQ